MKINLLVLRVSELARARDFYTALGLELAEERHGNGPVHWSAKLDDGGILELYPLGSSGATTSGLRFGMLLPGVDAAVDRARSAGGSLVSAADDSPWGRRAVIADPDGHKIELLEDDGIPW